MGKMICELCGGDDFIKEEGAFKCNSCGVKYSLEEARGLMKDDSQEQPSSSFQSVEELTKEDDNVQPDTEKEEQDPFEQFYEEFSARENLQSYTCEELIKKESEEVIGILNEIHKADSEMTRLDIEQSVLYKVASYNREFWRRDRETHKGLLWEAYYYMGLGQVIDKYIDPDNDSDYRFNSFTCFDNAIIAANKEIVRTRIFPFIDNIRKHYVKRYEAGLVVKTDEEGYKKELYRYLKFYNDWGDIESLAKSYADELREMAKPYTEEIKKILLKDKIGVVKQMNQYKERSLSVFLEVIDVHYEMGALKEQMNSHFMGPKAAEIEQKTELKQRMMDLEAEKPIIAKEAYEFYKVNLAKPKSESDWKHGYNHAFFFRAHDIHSAIHSANPNKEKIKELYDKLDEDLEGYGFMIDDYLDPFPEEYYEKPYMWDCPIFKSTCEASLTKTIYFYNGTQTDTIPAYTMKENRLYAGDRIDTPPVFTIRDRYIFKGDQIQGAPVLQVWEDKIYEDYVHDEEPVFTIEKDGIYEGTKTYLSPKLTFKFK